MHKKTVKSASTKAQMALEAAETLKTEMTAASKPEARLALERGREAPKSLAPLPVKVKLMRLNQTLGKLGQMSPHAPPQSAGEPEEVYLSEGFFCFGGTAHSHLGQGALRKIPLLGVIYSEGWVEVNEN